MAEVTYYNTPFNPSAYDAVRSGHDMWLRHEIDRSAADVNTAFERAVRISPLAIAHVLTMGGRINMLDAGCGTGRALHEMVMSMDVEEARVRATGIDMHDFSGLSLWEATNEAVRVRDIEYRVENICGLPSPAVAEGEFHVVYAYDVIDKQTHPDVLVGRLMDVTRPGGYLLLTASDTAVPLINDALASRGNRHWSGSYRAVRRAQTPSKRTPPTNFYYLRRNDTENGA